MLQSMSEQIPSFKKFPETKTSQEEVKRILSYLSLEKRVSVPTRNKTFNALLLLLWYVFDRKIDGLAGTMPKVFLFQFPRSGSISMKLSSGLGFGYFQWTDFLKARTATSAADSISTLSP